MSFIFIPFVFISIRYYFYFISDFQFIPYFHLFSFHFISYFHFIPDFQFIYYHLLPSSHIPFQLTSFISSFIFISFIPNPSHLIYLQPFFFFLITSFIFISFIFVSCHFTYYHLFSTHFISLIFIYLHPFTFSVDYIIFNPFHYSSFH